MKLFSLATLSALMLVTGCGGSSEFSDLRTKMEDIQKRPKGRIEPPPEFQTYTAFSYTATASRSPFSPPVAIESLAIPVKNNSNVKPDFNRPKEPLEDYSLDSLRMVGTLKRPQGSLYVLLQDPEGGLHRVQKGNYIGRNHGKIRAVDTIKLDVVEIVSDGQGGWIERPRTIVLAEKE